VVKSVVRCCSKLEFSSVIQVGVFRINNTVSSLSLRERARVRGAFEVV